MNRKQRRAAENRLPPSGKRPATAEPTTAKEHNELGCRLLAQGRLEDAAAQFARALTLMPEALEQYPAVVATLLNVNPAIRAGVGRVAAAWPRDLSMEELLGPHGIGPVARDPMLRIILESATVRDLDLERYLTSL